MKEELIKIVIENIGVIVSSGTTLFLAWIKKRIDLRKLKKEGKLFDFELETNGQDGVYKRKLRK